jgi:fructose/tagatose bisphosphate aldolase
LSIKRTLEIRDATGIPLVLHGASGIREEEIQAAKAAGRTRMIAAIIEKMTLYGCAGKAA